VVILNREKISFSKMLFDIVRLEVVERTLGNQQGAILLLSQFDKNER